MNREALGIEFERQIVAPLMSVGRRLVLVATFVGLCKCVAVVWLCVSIQYALDRLLDLGVGPRAALLGIALWAVISAARRWIVRPLRIRLRAVDVASLVETKDATLGDRLSSAVALASLRVEADDVQSRAMLDSLLCGICTDTDTGRFAHVIRRGIAARMGVVPLAFAVFLIACAGVAPDMLGVYASRNLLLRDVPWPLGVELDVRGFVDNRLRWPKGDPLTLVVAARGDVPRSLAVELATGPRVTVVKEMDRLGQREFVYECGGIDDSMRIRFVVDRVGVDRRTSWYEIRAIPRPAVRSASIQISPPDYVRRPAFTLPQGQTSATILRGSQITIEAELNKPIVQAVLRGTNDEEIAVEQLSDRRVRATFVPLEDDAYHFSLKDGEGMTDASPIAFSFRLLVDPPPIVRLGLSGAGRAVTPNAVLKLDVHCEDDLGMQRAEFVSLRRRPSILDAKDISESTERDPLSQCTPGQRRYDEVLRAPLVGRGLTPGDELRMQILGYDEQPEQWPPQNDDEMRPADAPPANRGASQVIRLEIVSAEELLGRLAQRELNWRREFEIAIKSQEQVNAETEACVKLSRGGEPHEANTVAAYQKAARMQRQQGVRLESILAEFEAILSELECNGLAGPRVNRRVKVGIIDPLSQMIRAGVPQTSAAIADLAAAFDDQTALRVEERQVVLLKTMYEVLAHMLESEGYQEIVTLLRDIQRMQAEINQRTQARLEEEMDRLFGGKDNEKP